MIHIRFIMKRRKFIFFGGWGTGEKKGNRAGIDCHMKMVVKCVWMKTK